MPTTGNMYTAGGYGCNVNVMDWNNIDRHRHGGAPCLDTNARRTRS
jgi:hypothetical protein